MKSIYSPSLAIHVLSTCMLESNIVYDQRKKLLLYSTFMQKIFPAFKSINQFCFI